MDLLVLQRRHVGHREVGINVIGVGDERRQRHHILRSPAGFERRVRVVELVENADQQLVVGGGKGCEVGDVLQRHGRVFPDGTDHAHVHNAVLDGGACLGKLVKRSAVIFTPTHFKFTPAFFQQPIHFGLEHLFHGVGPDVGGRMTCTDVDVDALLGDCIAGSSCATERDQPGKGQLVEFHAFSFWLNSGSPLPRCDCHSR